MDKSTIIYLIALGLFILVRAFGKKKNVAEDQVQGSPFDAIFSEETEIQPVKKSDPFDEIFQSFGKVDAETPEEKPAPNTKRGYSTEEVESEEEAYPAYKAQMLDSPSNAIFTPIDRVEPIYYNPALLSAENAASYGAKSAPMTTFEPEILEDEKVEIQEEEHYTSEYFTDFDLRKAMVYSEILKPKFQEI